MHTHVEVGRAGEDDLAAAELREAAREVLRRRAARRRSTSVAAYYRERNMAGRRLHGRRGVGHRPGRACRTRRSPRSARRERRRADPVRERRPARGPTRRRRGAAADRRARRARLQVPPERAGASSRTTGMAYPLYEVIAEAGLPALFHTGHTRHRHGPARRRRHPAEVLEPDAPRRRRRRLPRRCRSSSRTRRSRGRTRRSRSRLHKPQRLHRPLRLVAEVLPAAARAVREHAAPGQGAVRLRLPADHARPLAAPTSSRLDIKDEVRPLILKENAVRLLGLQ